MKKIIFVLFILLATTACSDKQYSYDESSAPTTMDNFSEADIISRMKDINNGLKPNVKPPKDSQADQAPAEVKDQPATPNRPASPAGGLENLAATYTSAIIKTNFGNVVVKFYGEDSPVTVNNFLNLAKSNFYNGTKFHRVIKDFMIQGGDPLSKDENNADRWGTGGPGYEFQDEFNQHKLVKGSLAMANSGPNTNGSQFFIVTAAATPWLDGKHTNFGYVASGLEVVEKIEKVKVDENDRPVEDVVIQSVELIRGGAKGE